MPAARSRAFSQCGDGADVDVPEQAADVPRAAVEVVDLDRHRLVAGELGLDARRRRQLGVEDRRHLARDAVDAEQVGPVVGGLEVEHDVGERQCVRERRAGLPLRPEGR